MEAKLPSISLLIPPRKTPARDDAKEAYSYTIGIAWDHLGNRHEKPIAQLCCAVEEEAKQIHRIDVLHLCGGRDDVNSLSQRSGHEKEREASRHRL